MMLPFNAPTIGLVWRSTFGGFGVTARTDSAALPIIGLYRLRPNGLQLDIPTIEFAQDELFQRVVIGRTLKRDTLTVMVTAQVTNRGLRLRVNMPSALRHFGYPSVFFEPWDVPLCSYD